MDHNLSTLLANAEDAASMMLYKTGGISAMLYLHAKEGIFGLPYKSTGLPVEIEQAIIGGYVRSCYKAGSFEGLVMISEAWVAKQALDSKDNRMPSERPDREERVLIVAWDRNRNKSLRMYPIIRNSKKVLLGSAEQGPDEFESWLDYSFRD